MDNISLPRFSGEKLAIWFAQVESVFTLNGISSDSHKYNYIVAHIPPKFTSIVEDIILNPPQEDRYDHIKYEFIKRMSIRMLEKQELGDETPSAHLQKLLKMADQRISIENTLKIWLDHLPKEVCDILLLEPSNDVKIIGPLADKVMALLSKASPQRDILQAYDQYEIILQRLDKLSQQVHEIKMMLDSEGVEEEQSPINRSMV